MSDDKVGRSVHHLELRVSVNGGQGSWSLELPTGVMSVAALGFWAGSWLMNVFQEIADKEKRRF